jgi:acetyltransferase-like isoleucine patch superfamily enzyme
MMGRLRSVLAMQPVNFFDRVSMVLARVKSRLYYAPQFDAFGKGSLIMKPTLISNPRFMRIGKNVTLRPGVRLEAVVADPENPPALVIGDNVNIEQDVHIVAIGKVVIGNNVSIAARSCILGGGHPFFDVKSPIKIGARLTGANTVTSVGDGSFLGVGSVIAMNVKLGAGVVVGSNAVVKRNCPANVVVEGNPSSIVLKYDQESDRWLPAGAKSDPSAESARPGAPGS